MVTVTPQERGNMRVVLCVTLLLSGAVNCGLVTGPVATLVRAPKYDSAIIQSDRLGGNFAYSTAEAHAYAVVSPIVQNVVKPVAVAYASDQVVAPVAVIPPVNHFVAVDSPVENVAKPVPLSYTSDQVSVIPSAHQVEDIAPPVAKPLSVSYTAQQVAPGAVVPPSTAIIDVPVPVHDTVASPSVISTSIKGSLPVVDPAVVSVPQTVVTSVVRPSVSPENLHDSTVVAEPDASETSEDAIDVEAV